MPSRFVIAASLLGGLFLLQACDDAAAPAVAPLTPVRVQTPTTTDLAKEIRYTANIEAAAQVNVAFKVTGYVTSLLQEKGPNDQPRDVQSGDAVTENTVLAIIDSKDAQNSVKGATAQVTAAQASATKASQDYSRAQALFKSNSMTAPDFDTAKQQYDTANAQLKSALAQQKTAENDLQDFNLKSPISGLVLQRNIDVGTLVAPGTVGFVIANTDRMKVVFSVPGTLSQTLKIGTPQSFTVQSVPDQTFNGKISEIAASADTSTRVFDVKIDVDNKDSLLKVGMIATLQIAKGDAPHAASLIPLSAIVTAKDNPDGYAVFLVIPDGEAKTVKRQPVELGQVYGNKIVVLNGLTPTDQVVVNGTTFVTDGEKVAVIP